MDASGDVWLYYNLAAYGGRAEKVSASLTAVGPHEELRYSHHWEKLAIASLHIAEAFQMACPIATATLPARRIVGEIAFESWRRLPPDFHPPFTKRLLAIWRRAPRGSISALGGSGFTALARILGPVSAGFLLRKLRGRSYSNSRTLTDEQLLSLLAEFPATAPHS